MDSTTRKALANVNRYFEYIGSPEAAVLSDLQFLVMNYVALQVTVPKPESAFVQPGTNKVIGNLDPNRPMGEALKAYMTPDECLDYLNTYFRVVDPSKYNHALFFLVRSLSEKICELGPLPSSPPKTAGVLAALDAVKVEANDRPGGQQPPRSA